MCGTNELLRQSDQFCLPYANRRAKPTIMAESPTAPRVFTAELHRCQFRRNLDTSKTTLCGDAAMPTSARTDTIPGLPESRLGNEPVTTLSALLNLTPTADNCDFLALQGEITQLKEAIEQMKREIATLRTDKSPGPSLHSATCELDAVVQATEDATHNILEAAEQIDTFLTDARSKPDAPVDPAILEQLGDQVIRIFESCNFQDITGQRITKVVTAVKFIEVKIDKMIDILGGKEALQDVEVIVEEEVDEDAKLLSGPQLDGESKISQNDIDRFFD